MKLALIQMESRMGEIETNVSAACTYIDQAAEGDADCIVLPEFFSTGYFPVYRDYAYYDLASDENSGASSVSRAASLYTSAKRSGSPTTSTSDSSPWFRSIVAAMNAPTGRLESGSSSNI